MQLMPMLGRLTLDAKFPPYFGRLSRTQGDG